MRRTRTEQPQTGSSWITTYGDMVTLLMTFFILLFSLSSMNQAKFERIQYSLHATFGGGPNRLTTPGGEGVLDGGPSPTPVAASFDETQLLEVIITMNRYIEENSLEDLISVQAEPRGVLIRFRDKVLFDLGKSELKETSMPVLDKVAEAVKSLPNEVRIEGHTDDLPIQTLQYPTNWHLSAARAVEVLRYLGAAANMDTERLSIAGYGEYRPVADNETIEGRRLNRRVDIVILTMAMGQNEPQSLDN